MVKMRALCSVVLSYLLATASAFAFGPEEAPGKVQRALSDVDREAAAVPQIILRSREVVRTPEQHIAQGEMLLRSKDYSRAITILSEAIERYPNHPTAYFDALSLLGEAYYQSNQLISARRTFRKVIEAPPSSNVRAVAYAPRSFLRLVDIAIQRQEQQELDALVGRMGAWPADGTLAYARAKACAIKRDVTCARSAVAAVPSNHLFYHQARYLQGLAAMREAQKQSASPTKGSGSVRYAAAIEAFRQVVQLSPDTTAHRHVIDQAWLAVGRLFYESDQWAQAADAYSHVDRTSPEFGTALYELAWVYVRSGDMERSARALELLAIVDPKNPYVADATILRGDLLLRSGKFSPALKLYQEVRGEFDPMRQRVDEFLASTTDPAVYYDKLSQQQASDGSGAAAYVPPLALRWAREEKDGPAAFALLDDVSQCRDLLKQSQDMVTKMGIILGAPNRVRAFADLKAGDQKLVELMNRITLARGTLAVGLDGSLEGEVSADYARVHRERKELQKRIPMMPVTDADIAMREDSADRQWSAVSQRLQQLQLEVDRLGALVNGLRHRLQEPNESVRPDSAKFQQWQTEVAAAENEVKQYREQVQSLRHAVELGRVQVGYGDQRFVEDERLREVFREKLKEELRLASTGVAGSKARSYAAQVAPLFGRTEATEKSLAAMRKNLEVEVEKKVAEVKQIIEKESGNLAGYTARLETLDQEVRVAVGNVAMRNFGLVRDRLRNIVLRADVGTVEHAWEVREEQVTRVRNLQVERIREEQILREELREVLDDASDPAPSSSP